MIGDVFRHDGDGADEGVSADVTVLADLGVGKDMGEMPDFGFFADGDVVVHDSSWVNEDIRIIFMDSRLSGNDGFPRTHTDPFGRFTWGGD